MKFDYTDEVLDELERVFSPERLARSYAEAGGDRVEGWQLYLRNAMLSEALYMPLQGLEILLRNTLGEKIRERYGDNWFDNGKLPLAYRQKQALDNAKSELQRRKTDLVHGRIIAELSYGFWTGILSRHYETSLWRPLFHKSFPYAPKPLRRKQVHAPLDELRLLRNRIAHHEPISDRNLMSEYEIIIELASWVSPEAANWIDSHNRFKETFSSE